MDQTVGGPGVGGGRGRGHVVAHRPLAARRRRRGERPGRRARAHHRRRRPTPAQRRHPHRRAARRGSQPAPAIPAGRPADSAAEPTARCPRPPSRELIAALEEAGFIDYPALAGSGDERGAPPRRRGSLRRRVRRATCHAGRRCSRPPCSTRSSPTARRPSSPPRAPSTSATPTEPRIRGRPSLDVRRPAARRRAHQGPPQHRRRSRHRRRPRGARARGRGPRADLRTGHYGVGPGRGQAAARA